MRRIYYLVIGLALAACAAHAQTYTYTVLDSFSGEAGIAPGEYPELGNLIQASDGNFYGTTEYGGNRNTGEVFKMTPSGVVTTLYSFSSTGVIDGAYPATGLIEGADGNLYGTTARGPNGLGVVYRVTLGGVYTLLHAFAGYPGDPAYPTSSLVQDANGDLFGVSEEGGSINGSVGTVYKISTVSPYPVTVLYTFSGSNGFDPEAPLVQATDGNFYSTVSDSGSSGYDLDGAIFNISPISPYSLTTLFYFTGYTGETPVAGLVESPNGTLYGLTSSQGTPNGSNDGSCISGTLYGYPLGGGDQLTSIDCTAAGPTGTPIFGSDGNLYFIADGQIWNVSLANLATPNLLYNFPNATMDGSQPLAGLIQGNDGNFYGTTEFGGADTWGTVFKLSVSPALPAPVQVSLSPSSIKIGATATLSWTVLNAFSETMQLCNGFATRSGLMTPLGAQAGTYSSTTELYTGSTTVTPTEAGMYSYALTCGGIESGLATLTVGPTTTTTLVASPSPATVGQSGTLTATVTSSEGTPNGSVTFYAGTDALETVALNNSGVATMTASTNGLAPGTYPLTAQYTGSSTYNSSTSATYDEVLNAAPTETILASSATTVTPPASVTLTATVKRSTSEATGTPTGTVTFYSGTAELGTGTLNASGVASLTGPTTGIAAGKYSVTAKYGGDAGDVASTSNTVSITVK